MNNLLITTGLGFLGGALIGIGEDVLAYQAALKVDPSAEYSWTQMFRRAISRGLAGAGIAPGFNMAVAA